MRMDLPLVSTCPKSSTSLSESELPEARQNLPARFWIGGGGGWTEGDLLAGVLGGMVAGGLGIAQPHDPRIPLDPKKELAELHSSSSVLITRRWLTITTAVTLNVSTYHSYRVKKRMANNAQFGQLVSVEFNSKCLEYPQPYLGNTQIAWRRPIWETSTFRLSTHASKVIINN